MKQFKNLIGVSLLVLAFSISASETMAQCATPPSCETLGFNQTSSQCKGKYTLKCPFDTNKVYCTMDLPIIEIGGGWGKCLFNKDPSWCPSGAVCSNCVANSSLASKYNDNIAQLDSTAFATLGVATASRFSALKSNSSALQQQLNGTCSLNNGLVNGGLVQKSPELVSNPSWGTTNPPQVCQAVDLELKPFVPVSSPTVVSFGSITSSTYSTNYNFTKMSDYISKFQGNILDLSTSMTELSKIKVGVMVVGCREGYIKGSGSTDSAWCLPLVGYKPIDGSVIVHKIDWAKYSNMVEMSASYKQMLD